MVLNFSQDLDMRSFDSQNLSYFLDLLRLPHERHGDKVDSLAAEDELLYDVLILLSGPVDVKINSRQMNNFIWAEIVAIKAFYYDKVLQKVKSRML